MRAPAPNLHPQGGESSAGGAPAPNLQPQGARELSRRRSSAKFPTTGGARGARQQQGQQTIVPYPMGGDETWDIYAPGFRVQGPPPGCASTYRPPCPDAPPGSGKVRLLSAPGAPEPVQRQGRSTTLPLSLSSASAPQPQGGRRHIDEDPAQDLEHQRCTPTWGGGRSTRIAGAPSLHNRRGAAGARLGSPLRISSASAPHPQGAEGAPGGSPSRSGAPALHNHRGGGGTLTRIPLRIWSASARRRCP